MPDDEDLTEQGRPKFTAAPAIEAIAPMPETWTPRDHTPIGVEAVKPDAKSQRIADAFDIMDQKINWLGEAVVSMNDNLRRVMQVAEEALRLGIVANRRLDAEEERPYKALWSFVKTAALMLATAVATVAAEWLFKR